MNAAEKAKTFANLFGGELTARLNAECLMIDEAICWIAFGAYGFPNQGPKTLAEFFIFGDFDAYFSKESDEQSLRFDIARSQLFSAAANRKVDIFGVPAREYVDDGATEEEMTAAMMKTIDRIEPECFLDGNWEEAEHGYAFRGRSYDGVFAERAGLEELFGALRLPAASRPIPEADASELAYDAKLKRRGRRPKWNWELIIAGTLYEIGKAGNVIATQSDLERRIAEFCQCEYSNEPAQSMIRSKASPIFEFISRKSR
jgi:hypothetical protein